ncbi:MAG: hypothetical protein WCR33_02065 [Bacilli bacterium]
MTEQTKKIFQTLDTVLMYILAISLVLLIVYEKDIFIYTTITIGAFNILFSVLALDKINGKALANNINLYYYIMVILIAISKMLKSEIMFRICIGLFILIIVVYILEIFITKKKKAK